MVRMSVWLGLVALAVGAFLLWRAPSGATADEGKKQSREREVTLDQLPPRVRATILKAAGKNKVEEVEQVTRKLYEAEWIQDGKEIEVLVTPKGKLLAKEVEKADDDDEDEGEEHEAAERHQRKHEAAERHQRKHETAEKGQKKHDEDEDEDEDDDEEEEHERNVSIDQIPAPAKATILKLAGKNQVKEIEETYKKFYEAEWTYGKREIEILVTHGGKIVKRENEKADDDQGDDEDEDEDDDNGDD